jgi:signal transduction histidine kinase
MKMVAMIGWIQNIEQRSKPALLLTGLAFLVLVGVVDYLTGVELFFSVFYLLGVGWATWFVGRGYGILMSILSVIVWLAGDVASGAKYSSPFIPAWNAMIFLVFYFIVVWLLTHLRSLQKTLEERVEQRTLALQQEMTERARLEKEIVEIGERERRRIGRDLHDSLCQHLTGTALAGQVLGEKLAAQASPEVADAGKVVELVEEGIALARQLARGLYPVEMDAEGLMAAFQEMASTTASLFKITCVFECNPPVLIHDAAAATHLYHIAQEAVRNAVSHGKARRIMINLATQEDRVVLTVTDDGAGLPEDFRKSQGLGIRIMAHRAAMIGGGFDICPGPNRGVVVTCSLPNPAQPLREEHPIHEHKR